jgi:hypothetical protein
VQISRREKETLTISPNFGTKMENLWSLVARMDMVAMMDMVARVDMVDMVARRLLFWVLSLMLFLNSL